ncbi:MAG: toll/interleukin-1 receptor domain-containing protein [Acetatifactor sp.]|nr:toll/interleukin-1 receptor domain-containing protein [Acetatifactor sp.]
MENTKLEKKNVFISYCHKDVTEEWIDKLVSSLGQYGIYSIVDIYDLQLGQDLSYFMEQIKKVDKVLMLLGKEYKERANNRQGGVGTETQIISCDVYNDVEQTKFIPIVIDKDENGDVYLPYYLETRLYIDFSDEKLFKKNSEELARQIHDLPKRKKPIVLDPPVFLNKSSNALSSSIDRPKLSIIQNLWSKIPSFELVNDSDVSLDYIPSPSYFIFIPSKIYFQFKNGERYSLLTLSPVSYDVIEQQIVTGSTRNKIIKSILPVNFYAKKGERDVVSCLGEQTDDHIVYIDTLPFLVIISKIIYSYHDQEYEDILLSTALQSISIDEKTLNSIQEYLRDNYKYEVKLPKDSSSIYKKTNEQVAMAWKDIGNNQTFFCAKEGGYNYVMKQINGLITPIDPIEQI